jgi:hypothetical protein
MMETVSNWLAFSTATDTSKTTYPDSQVGAVIFVVSSFSDPCNTVTCASIASRDDTFSPDLDEHIHRAPIERPDSMCDN